MLTHYSQGRRPVPPSVAVPPLPGLPFPAWSLTPSHRPRPHRPRRCPAVGTAGTAAAASRDQDALAQPASGAGSTRAGSHIRPASATTANDGMAAGAASSASIEAGGGRTTCSADDELEDLARAYRHLRGCLATQTTSAKGPPMFSPGPPWAPYTSKVA